MSFGRPRLDSRTFLKYKQTILSSKKDMLLTVQWITVSITCNITWALRASLQVGSCKIAMGIVRYEQRQNWNIIHFAEQLVSPPIRCFWKYGRIYAWSVSRSKTLTTVSDSLVLSWHTCKCNLIYACKKSTSLPTRIFTKLNSTMCKFLLDIYISLWLVLYPLVVTNCGSLEWAKWMKWNKIPNFAQIGQQMRKIFFYAPKQRKIFIASIFT
jgi:hypothetical protein